MTAKQFVNKKAPVLECFEYNDCWYIRDSNSNGDGVFVHSEISEDEAWKQAKIKLMSYDKKLIVKGNIMEIFNDRNDSLGTILTHCDEDEIEGLWWNYTSITQSNDFECFVDYLNENMGIPTEIIEPISIHLSY